ncbi:DNA gyrase/topoisomerase IV subunit A [Cuneatibacter caecimuris]|uniref:DNA topoisomerase (ATP-hydrolyzing) n=1 Tax=Cuneatibacter caecimuris TaxID=1796618 RepID=A0A4Q7NZY7_9FIRM|nr:DNA topoisomerase (ATP-hydrolyzing) [Cuneatibacter caecimuris]RZS92837.1 DNA gyrase subunit A [Cuneatibacter caecimuris]
MAESITTTEFSSEMQQAYINYSMSVIMARAVPDIRDGLKPVQRRVLFAMNELGLNADKPHRKSARIVGDAMGKYHPHGDSSIYDALVVMSQDFKKGMALVDGHGNFGSIEGDGAAAMRYTEARLKKFTQEVYLADLDKDVVDFKPNFDETEEEPEVLPVRVPNFLVNGSEGIAVGMTTSVPTHNLGEVIDGVKLLIDNPAATTEDLMAVIQGPDFPTGGIVINKSDLKEIYESGRGRIKVRGKAEIQRGTRRTDKDQIVITEIPYTMVGANISKFLSDVAALVENKKLPDILDISNQSSKEGIRIVLELRKGADAERILQALYKKTKLEDTFGVNMLAIAGGKPETLSLKRVLEEHVQFQMEVNTRKYRTLLKKETARKEIQEGLIRAVDIIDLIIEIIRGSKTLKTAKNCLITGETQGITFRHKTSEQQARKLCFTEAQATAILELRLSKLIGLEILALEKEHGETVKKIARYEKLLGSRRAMLDAIKGDLDHIKKEYGLPRKTQILDAQSAVYEEEPEKEVPAVFLMNRFGYVKTMEESLFQKNEESVMAEHKLALPCMSTGKICLFTGQGNLHQIKVQDIPSGKPKDKGVPIENISNFNGENESGLLFTTSEAMSGRKLLFATKRGLVKIVDASEFETIKKTIASTKLGEGDELVSVEFLEKSELILVSQDKTYLRFAAEEIPEMKKASAGVRGMKLAEGDAVCQIIQADPGESVKIKLGSRRYGLDKLKKRDARPEKIIK